MLVLDIKRPIIEPQINVPLPKVDIHGNLPSLGGIFDVNANIDIKPPKVDAATGSLGVDIKGPKIGGGIDIKGPKIGAPSLDIGGPKFDLGIGLPWIDIKGPKIGVRINNKLYGWYFYCFNSTLYSDSPYNFKNKKTNLEKIEDEIKIIMDMKKRTLNFKIDNENEEIAYIDIPIDYPITPSIILYDLNDSVKIIEE